MNLDASHSLFSHGKIAVYHPRDFSFCIVEDGCTGCLYLGLNASVMCVILINESPALMLRSGKRDWQSESQNPSPDFSPV